MLNLTKRVPHMQYMMCHKWFFDCRKIWMISWHYLTKYYQNNSEVIVKIALALEARPIPKQGRCLVTNGINKQH